MSEKRATMSEILEARKAYSDAKMIANKAYKHLCEIDQWERWISRREAEQRAVDADRLETFALIEVWEKTH